MRRRWLVLTIGLIGCGPSITNPGPDPASDRLPAGTTAIVTSLDGKAISLSVARDSGISPGIDFQYLELGTKVLVDDDRATSDRRPVFLTRPKLKYEPTGEEYEQRPTRVTVLEGEFKGRTGRVARYQLRAVPK